MVLIYVTSVLISGTSLSQSALGNDYVADVAKHSSQTDAAKGFGGKYGVQTDRTDKVRDENGDVLICDLLGLARI